MFTPFSTVYAQNRCNGFHSAYCFSSDLRIMIFYILRNKPAQHQANQYCTYFLRGEVCLICYALKIFRLKFQNTIHQIFFAFKCNVCFFCVCMIFFLNFKTFQDLICGEKMPAPWSIRRLHPALSASPALPGNTITSLPVPVPDLL